MTDILKFINGLYGCKNRNNRNGKKPFYKIKKGKVKHKLGAFYITIMGLLWDDYETFILLLRDY